MTLGRVGSGTLKLTQDDYGLRYELDLPDTSYARDMKISVQRKDSDFCSFGFICPAGGDSVALIGDQYYRTLRDVNLYEISLGVTFPAYSGTSVIIRSRAGHPAGFKPSTPLLDRALRRLRLLEL